MSARNRVPQVADVLARLLDFLVENGFTQMSRVNIAGHSLGAHIAGLTGKRVTRGRIQVIFALDPAGLLFSLNSPNDRIAADDAVYTEGIRTNAGNLGFTEPLCHADFYPNWGSRCVKMSLKFYLSLIYFYSSVNPDVVLTWQDPVLIQELMSFSLKQSSATVSWRKDVKTSSKSTEGCVQDQATQ